jgi:hypothetical protein
MLIYRFSVHNADGSGREIAGRMALTDDNAARAFGKAMIRDMARRDGTRYAGWTMDVAKGTRSVCSIAFPPGTKPAPATSIASAEDVY